MRLFANSWFPSPSSAITCCLDNTPSQLVQQHLLTAALLHPPSETHRPHRVVTWDVIPAANAADGASRSYHLVLGSNYQSVPNCHLSLQCEHWTRTHVLGSGHTQAASESPVSYLVALDPHPNMSSSLKTHAVGRAGLQLEKP